MCGLVGVAGKLTHYTEKVYKCLLELDTTRGPHSTGSLVVRSGGDTEVVKDVGTPWDLYQNYRWRPHLASMNLVLMGHNRYATKGGITKHTAHPFEINNIIGAHNGTLTRQNMLDDSSYFDVDSENLYYHMDKNGLNDTVGKLYGAYALTWYDKTDGSMNFLRNRERTLFYTSVDDCLFWASEEWMLEVALNRNNIKCGTILPFAPDNHYKIIVNSSKSSKEPVLGKPHIQDKSSFQPKLVVYNPYVPKKLAPYVPKSNTLLQPLVSIYKSSVGSIVDLRASKVVMDTSQSHIEFKLVCDARIICRCYCHSNNELWDSLTKDIGGLYSAKARDYKFVNGDSYLLLDTRSIKKKLSLVGLGDVHRVNGRIVSSKKWYESTKQGCAICADPILMTMENDIEWINDTEFACDSCKTTDLALSYLVN
jgi:predicted glutamine amidotransferase